MAEDKRNNNPLNNIKPKSNQQKPKFNMSYFYIVLILILFGINFFATGKHSVETSWNEVKNTMIKNNDVSKIVVVNKEEANIYLKESSYEKYKDKLGKDLAAPALSVHISRSRLVLSTNLKKTLKKLTPISKLPIVKLYQLHTTTLMTGAVY